MRPPPQILRTIAEAQSKIFSTTPPPPIDQPSLRTGAKYLRKRLVGPSMLNYYPPILNLRSFERQFPHLRTLDPVTGKIKGGLIDPVEASRLQDVNRKRSLGRGPPKKGEGRRATMRAKGKTRK